jgi:tetratricopeptide (TPR) repeat protein
MTAGEEGRGGAMSSDALYELYKDALKRGHVASLRGRLDDALLAYAEAATIAPERSTPHSSAGTALLRRRRPADAIRHYEVALAMAPHDEAALLGRAQALTAMDRRSDAADAYDALAEVRSGSGKLADAVDAARRGLEMAEGRERRRTLERLIRRLRASEPDEPGRLALERALRVLDGAAVPSAPAVAVDMAVDAPPFPEEPVLAAPDPAPTAPAPAPAGVHPAPAAVDPASAPPAREPIAWPAADRRPDRPPSVSTKPSAQRARGPLDRDLVFGATVADLERHAREAVDAGVPGPALEAYLDLATAYRREGHVDAALDACYAALTFDPDGIPLHLALVELYDAAGWEAAATEKLALVETLARLDDDASTIELVAAVRAGRD